MISVCIPTYNGEKFIKQQLDSILSQLKAEDEVIISDDSSIDLTVSIIKGYNDPRIKLIENCQFKSPIFNLENSLKQAKGELIFLSDQDDIWLNNKVEVLTNLLLNYDLVVSDCRLIDAQNIIIKESFFESVNAKKGFFHNLKKNGYLGCCMAFRNSLLKKILPFPKRIAMHDIWIGLLSEIVAKPFFYNKPLVLYRKHELNATPFTSGVSQNPILYRIKYRITITLLVIFRTFNLMTKIK